ncbi:MAG: energy transducer TonB [Sphingomonas bacterium]|jgi:protein TonB|nr:energy transducer TonB [Sphingomonas bacterium]
MAYVDNNSSKEKAASGVASVLLVGAIGYAFVTGLAMRIIHNPDPPFIVKNYPDNPLTPPKPIPPQPQTQPRTTAHLPSPLPQTTDFPPPTWTGPTLLGPATTSQGDSGAVPLPQPKTADFTTTVRPRGNPAEWVTTDDYPSSALRSGQEGRSVLRLDIGANGQPTACSVVQSSGSDDLDRTACRVLMRKARFTPAKDAQGEATTATYTSSVLWRIPKD